MLHAILGPLRAHGTHGQMVTMGSVGSFVVSYQLKIS
nr:MAG TPA: hypothetical protein [Caudoviricetes sp.]